MRRFRVDPVNVLSREPLQARHGFPESPCIDICTLDDDKVCIGCRRTVDEICDWARMTAQQQWSVVQALPARAAK